MKRTLALAFATLIAGCSDNGTTSSGDMAMMPTADMAMMPTTGDMAMMPTGDMAQPPAPSKKVIVFVWDGLRPDSINATDTPNLLALKQAGVEFTDNHSTYPTFTMMNAAAFATGSFPGTTGFYGNSLWQQGPTGNSSAGTPADFTDPVFTEDYGILQDLDAYYNNQLLLVGTLFQAAQAAGLKTAAIGKSGAAFLQDYKKGGYIVDEKMIMPLTLAQEVQATDVIPALTPFAYASGTIKLGTVNGNPTASAARKTLLDGATGDATDTSGAPPAAANAYLMDVYLRYVLPKQPDVTLIWFRSPDSPEHNYGPGSPNFHAALQQQDIQLGLLEKALKNMGIDQSTDLIIVSDHGHSSVSGPLDLFPPRAIASGAVGAVDTTNGWSVSGDVRLADLMTQTNPATSQPYFTNVFDGQGCLYVPVMSGLTGTAATGTPIYATQTDDATGTKCGKANMKYTTGSYVVPSGTLPAKSIVIATNGGSDYLYVPDHDATTVQNVISFLQSREEVGAIFVHSRYNDGNGHPPAGTLPMTGIKVENTGRAPGIIFSYNFDETAVIAGKPGIEFESMSGGNNRGMHGSFSPIDVHNTLLAMGPDFKTGFQDALPTGNVDVAPTVAKIFGLSLPHADGRSLDEALNTGGAQMSDYQVASSVVNPTAPATGLTFKLPTDPTGATADSAKATGSYSIDLHIKTLTKGSSSWTYFDTAKANRQ